MFRAVLDATAGFLLFEFIGLAIFTVAEVFLPVQVVPVRDRVRGILFASLPAPLYGAFSVALNTVPVTPLFTFESGFGSPVIAAVGLALFLDFQFYWLHRIEHRFLWRFHAVHHSIRDVCAAKAFHHWTEPIWAALMAGGVLLIVDVQIAPTLGFLTALFKYQSFFIHSPSKLSLGPLRWVLIDHRFHRLHHSVEPQHFDRNFGAMTPLWDWLFGTLHMPAPNEWPDVGLADKVEPRTVADWATAPFRSSSSDGGGQRALTSP